MGFREGLYLLNKLFLLLGSIKVIVPIIVLSTFIPKYRNCCYSAIFVVVFSIILNTALKITFKVPLNPALNKDWFSFPSGHMQCATVFYLWICSCLDNKRLKIILFAFISAILAAIGHSLVYFGYHNYFDVAGGLFCGILIVIYCRHNKHLGDYHVKILNISMLVVLYIFISYKILPMHTWVSFCILLIYTIIQKILCKIWIFKEKTLNR